MASYGKCSMHKLFRKTKWWIGDYPVYSISLVGVRQEIPYRPIAIVVCIAKTNLSETLGQRLNHMSSAACGLQTGLVPEVMFGNDMLQ